MRIVISGHHSLNGEYTAKMVAKVLEIESAARIEVKTNNLTLDALSVIKPLVERAPIWQNSQPYLKRKKGRS